MKKSSAKKRAVLKISTQEGLLFFAKDKIEVNSLLSLSISLPDTTDFQAKAQVVWYDSVQVSWDPEIRYEGGIKFIEIDEENRQKISKYVFLRLNIG